MSRKGTFSLQTSLSIDANAMQAGSSGKAAPTCIMKGNNTILIKHISMKGMITMRSDLNKIIESSRGIERINLDDHLLSERKIFLEGDISSENCTDIIKALMLMDGQADKEITLYINSPGGDCESGLALYDAIRMTRSKVRAVCVGLCASMGAVIYLAADQREILPHSRIMIHDPSFGKADFSGQKSKEIEEHLAGLNKMRETLASIIAERTGRTLEEIYKVTQYDSFYTAKEAVDFGLAHKIINTLI